MYNFDNYTHEYKTRRILGLGKNPVNDGTPTMPDQRLVVAGGEEDHQPHSKTLKHPTSSMDDGTPNSQISQLSS